MSCLLHVFLRLYSGKVYTGGIKDFLIFVFKPDLDSNFARFAKNVEMGPFNNGVRI